MSFLRNYLKNSAPSIDGEGKAPTRSLTRQIYSNPALNFDLAKVTNLIHFFFPANVESAINL